MAENDYVTRVHDDPAALPRDAWNALLAHSHDPSPFVRHEYLCALHQSDSAAPHTGWAPRFVSLWRGDELHAACPLYLKSHSYGEYVFDWAWAEAYQRHGLCYYPKAVIAVPFTPVPGARLLARDQHVAAQKFGHGQATPAGFLQFRHAQRTFAATDRDAVFVDAADSPRYSSGNLPRTKPGTPCSLSRRFKSRRPRPGTSSISPPWR
mgnify:CR=1 FL=1